MFTLLYAEHPKGSRVLGFYFLPVRRAVLECVRNPKVHRTASHAIRTSALKHSHTHTHKTIQQNHVNILPINYTKTKKHSSNTSQVITPTHTHTATTEAYSLLTTQTHTKNHPPNTSQVPNTHTPCTHSRPQINEISKQVNSNLKGDRAQISYVIH